ncbi:MULTISPECIES: LacI family DNA-binding transcriptional regulator [unclassified Sphingobacterium]|uniref:LacI family DNA-binding transcriptional regulator n=1 Tax=unclassified Sphingobacterium TaxID=2609468 RepID=UPI001AE923C7|nr:MULTISPECIES: LacI family DNA-binding transcriptional regulator [unclassified Sphingobacterium]MDR6737761.1 LacI family transcriptional regulator [Sphingobacterium sp. 2149]
MKKRILISDIAKALGISVTTVSFILNDKAKEKRISEALTKRVLDYVKKVGYKPNELAKSLRTGKTKILGLIIEDISNPFFGNIARLIESKVYEQGYRIIYCSTNNDVEKAKELIQMFYDRQVDGFIITPSDGLEDTVKQLQQNNIPVVLFDRYFPGLETDYVGADNFQGAFDASDHLCQQGYRRIGFVSLYSDQTQMKERSEGYLKAMDNNKQQSFIQKIQMDASDEEAMEALREFICENRLDAVLFSTNYLAISGLKASKKYNFPMPAVIAFDDHTAFKLVEPSITVVSQPIKDIAENLINILLLRLQGKIKATRKMVLPCELKVRESTKVKVTL